MCLHKPYDLKLDPKENSESSLEESIKGKFKQKNSHANESQRPEPRKQLN